MVVFRTRDGSDKIVESYRCFVLFAVVLGWLSQDQDQRPRTPMILSKVSFSPVFSFGNDDYVGILGRRVGAQKFS